MKYFLLVLFFVMTLYADIQKDNSKSCTEMSIIEYHKQFIKLNNQVMDIDTSIEKTNKDIANLDLQFIMQKKYYEELLNNQKNRFENLMETERWIFGLIGGFFLVIFAILSFFGSKFINNRINKLTRKEYKKNLIKNIKNSFIEDEDLQRAIISELIKNDEFKAKVKVLTENTESFKGLSNE